MRHWVKIALTKWVKHATIAVVGASSRFQHTSDSQQLNDSLTERLQERLRAARVSPTFKTERYGEEVKRSKNDLSFLAVKCWEAAATEGLCRASKSPPGSQRQRHGDEVWPRGECKPPCSCTLFKLSSSLYSQVIRCGQNSIFFRLIWTSLKDVMSHWPSVKGSSSKKQQDK